MKKEQIAINTVSLRGTFEEILSASAEAGFRKVEFPLSQVKEHLARGKSVADARALIERLGLRCIGGFDCGVVCFGPADKRAENHARVEASARMISGLGGSNMVVGTDGPQDLSKTADVIGDIARVFAEVAARVKPLGVTLCVEFNWSPVVKSMRTACEVARRSGAANVGVIFDPAHYHCTPSKLDQINAENVRFVRHVHVNDMRDKPGELSNCNSDRVLPGDGCLDVKGLIKALEKHGYKGDFAIELFNEELWATPPAKAAKLMYERMAALCGGR